MTILVTGGAGYIGSHVVKALGEQGETLIVLDNLSTGFREAVIFGELVEGDLADTELLERLFEKYKFEAVFHFAGSIVVSESVRDPLKYYRNNTLNSLNLIEACVKHKTKSFIFSSTAAVYGHPEGGVCSEKTSTNPINPYGHSKFKTETMLLDAANASDLKFVALRYFNVAGADSSGTIGQSFPDATHLIKVACEVALGKREELNVYGTNYPTPDGTCIRDYIHIRDLTAAHIQALKYLRAHGKPGVFNCGYGHGVSVLEVIERVKEITGKNFKVAMTERREGDPAMLIANSDLIRKEMGWVPEFDDLDLMIQSAYDWEKNKRY